MVLGCVLAGFSLGFVPGFIACTVLIGICTGFYLVPLFTLLQYRAPKASKGDMIASSNFINVTGAITASLLFAALVWVAKSTEFIPTASETDRIAEGELLQKELIRGRAVYVLVGDVAFGHKPTYAEQHENVLEHLFAATPAKSRPEIHIGRTVDVGDSVVVSHYQVAGVDHYALRLADEEPKSHYDARGLPRFLFLGAGLMTLGVLLVLWWRVRDLPARALGLLRSMAAKRFVPEGLVHVPGDGPVVLLVESGDAAAIRAVRSAVDRYVAVFDPKMADDAELASARAVLDRGDVVAVLTEAPAAAAMADALGGLRIAVKVEGPRLVFAII
jgi:hypothetical protein